MCLATVYIEDNGQKEETMHDVAWIESKNDGLLMATLFGEQKLFQNKIKSIDLVDGSIVLKREVNSHGDFQVEEAT